MSDSSEDYDSEESEQKVERVPYAKAALGVPYRMQQDLLRNLGTPKGPNRFDELCNWFGVVSCVCWLLGFILLAHWLRSVGATRMGLLGCHLKLVASVFFNLQPMTGTMNDALLGGTAGLWWSNLTGILFFHVGNIVSCLDFYLHTPPGASKSKGWLDHGNLPITGMWMYQAATWFLVASNFMACGFNSQFSWAPLVPIKELPVFGCQFAGGFLLLAGSVVYTVWCDGFRNFSHP